MKIRTHLLRDAHATRALCGNPLGPNRKAVVLGQPIPKVPCAQCITRFHRIRLVDLRSA